MHTNKPRNPTHNPDPGKTREPEPGRDHPLNPGGVVENPSDTPRPGTDPSQPVDSLKWFRDYALSE